MNPIDIIDRHYPQDSIARRILLTHGRQVAQKALAGARRLSHPQPDMVFIEEAALLHDIGMIRTDVPGIGCTGEAPYIQHGIIGRNMLENAGFPDHAMVCERHVGVGLGVEDIRRQGLPLPERDMRPVTLEEELICWADKFFSKMPDGTDAPKKAVDTILAKLSRRGDSQIRRFIQWNTRFGDDTPASPA
jgi:uncharacterized protein